MATLPYSLERRRERLMIIYGWQQLEEVRENVLRLTATTSRRDRRIISPKIPSMANGKRLSQVEKKTNILLSIQKKIKGYLIASLLQ